MTAAGLAKSRRSKKKRRLGKCLHKFNIDAVPTDLKEALMKETAAWNNFNRFANSYRNIYVFWVNQAKTAQTRQKRIETVVEQSLKNIKLMFQ